MSQKPILPARLALDTVDELQGFVSAMLYVRNVKTREAIKSCLFNDDPIIKGPFFQLKQPFESVFANDWPLDPRLKDANRAPYTHQFTAYKRLRHKSASNTLITTGTGSGKSECFQLPILDYVLSCKENGKTSGVKALILYPMNALIDDQAGRFAELANKLNESLPDNKKIRVGRYTGGGGKCTELNRTSPRQVIDHRDTLCASPPDILLTNYRMLDFMLYRPEEHRFWDKTTAEVFKYLVLDEVHTYDGAQGADVACLLRRLKLKLNSSYVVVGTSATVQGDTKKELCNFLSTLSGETFDETSIITETRIEHGYLKPKGKWVSPPTSTNEIPDLLLLGVNTYGDYIKAVASRWGAPIDPAQLGEWIFFHPLTPILVELSKQFTDFETACAEASCNATDLGQFLDLIAFAKRNQNGTLRPVLNLQTQLWVQEVKMLLRELSPTPSFIRPISLEKQGPGDKIFLPSAHCKECGASAWVTILEGDAGGGDGLRIETDRLVIQSAFYEQRAHLLFETKGNIGLNDDGLVGIYHYRSNIRRLFPGVDTEGNQSVPVLLRFQRNADFGVFPKKAKGTKQESPEYCPECESRVSLQLTNFGVSMLGSVAASAFLANGANPEDKKILFFNDSIQDASHQAGYLSSRGYRFNIRRHLYGFAKRVSDAEGGNGFSRIKDLLKKDITALFKVVTDYREIQLDEKAKASESNIALGRNAIVELLSYIPQDQWERWEALEFDPLANPEVASQELIDRVTWEFILELGQNSSIGWSLRKTGVMCFDPGAVMLENWENALNLALSEKAEFRKLSNTKSFLFGLIRRIATRGAFDHEDLRSVYEKDHFSLFALTYTKPHLASLFLGRGQRPKVLSLESRSRAEENKKGIEYLLPTNGKSNWYRRWAAKHGVDDVEIYVRLFQKLKMNKAKGLLSVGPESFERFMFDSSEFELTVKGNKLYRCNECANIESISTSFNLKTLACTQNRCNGQMTEKEGDSTAFASYMARQYGRSIIPIYGHAHTGQLEASDRRKIELAFKNSLLPGDRVDDGSKKISRYNEHPVNLLACTPTLEMGIDIGDLSGVALRSFPRTLANIQQRLGRAGRKTGMAFNSILTKIRPHDLHYWDHPEEVHRGIIRTPGCSYKNHQLLFRQFNAFCLDVFASQNPGIEIPSLCSNLAIPYEEEPFWLKTVSFIKSQSKELIEPFSKAMLRSGESHADEQPITEAQLKSFLRSQIEKQVFAKELQKSLKEISKFRSMVDKQNKPAFEQQKQFTKESTVESIEAQLNAASAEGAKKSAGQIWKSLQEMDYLFKKLGDKGLLPNYAFQEEGIRLRASIWVPQDAKAKELTGKTFRFSEASIERPPRTGLTELAPGQTYYIDGYKVPIIRVNRSSTLYKDPEYHTVCNYCGNVGKLTSDTPVEVDVCRNCNNQSRVYPLIRYHETEGFSHFGDAQIRDQEEDRERKPMRVETFINRSDGDNADNKQLSWLCADEQLGIEFRTNTKIHYINRGEKKDLADYKLFPLCPECWAVPEIKEGKERDEYIFENKQGDRINRHHSSCKFRSNPNSNEIAPLKTAVSRSIVSDAILVRADTMDDLPTLKAILTLTMNIYLKGNPGHLRIDDLILQPSESGHQYLAIMYDNVPGGSGHLRSLMQLKETGEFDGDSGLDRIKKVLLKTHDLLNFCNCADGCYQCLFRFENQFEHRDISKARGLAWITRFINAKSWVPTTTSLTSELLQNPAFESYSEQRFIEGLTQRTMSGFFGVDSVAQTQGTAETIFELKLAAGNPLLLIKHSPNEKVQLKQGYTKPDFHIFKPGNSAPIAYLYVDGASVHIEPQKEIPTLLQDWDLRKRLQQEHGVPVLSFTYEMIDSWIKAGKGNTIQIKSGPPHQINRLLLSMCVLLPSGTFENLKNVLNLEELFCAFISHQIAMLAGTSQGIVPTNLALEIEAGFTKYLNVNRSYGGLSWNGTEFELRTDLETRLRGGTETHREFKNAWALFWILWQIMPEKVKLVSPKTKAAKAS